MATRRERVVLELDDAGYSTKMAKDAAATMLLRKELDKLDGKRVGRDLGEAAVQTDRLATSARKADADINKLSGRIRLFADAALVLGPGLAPIGAVAIPALVGLSAQLGAAAGAAGVAALAFSGVGDGLEALNEYQLDPTAENLAKLGQELEKLGPSGEQFVRFLDGIGPELKSLQMAARDGLLPGAEEGITNLLELLPEVRNIITNIATTMGDLASDAGASLSGEGFEDFFDYLQSDAGPILDDLGRTIGNVAQGIGELMVAFGPLTTDFSDGLLEASRGFAEWADGLSSSQGFAEFTDYIRSTGPQVLDTLTALGNALLQIVQAAAPLGGPVLQALEAMANSIATIADSDLGTPILAALAALSLYNRAAAVTTRLNQTSWGGPVLTGMKDYRTSLLTVTSAQQRAQMSATQLDASIAAQAATAKAGRAAFAQGALAVGGLALATTGLGDKMGVSNAATLALMGSIAGPWGAAVGGGVGLALDFAHANDGLSSSLDRVNAALGTSNIEELAAALAQANTELERIQANTIFGSDALGDRIGGIVNAIAPLSNVGKLMGTLTGDTSDTAAAAAEAEARIEGLKNGTIQAFNPVASFASALGESANAAVDEANALMESVDAMRAKRSEALRGLDAELNYKASILDARDALKENGKTVNENTRAGQANLNSLYALANAWNNQSDAVKGAQGSLKAARTNFIQTAQSMGMGEKAAKRLADAIFEVKPKKVDVNANVNGLGEVQTLNAELSRVVSKSINVTVNRVGDALNGLFGADGTTVPKTGLPYADRFPYMLADGEEVISNRHGQADRNRPLLKAINAGFLAGGGTVHGRTRGPDAPSGATFLNPGDSGLALIPWQQFANATGAATSGLKGLEKQVDKAKNALDKETSKLEQLTSQRDSLSSSVTSSLLNDPFGNGLAGFQAQNAADAADSAAMLSALQTLVRNGLDPKGALFQALAASGDITTAQQMASLTSQQLSAEQSSFNQTQAIAGQVGAFAGNEAFGTAIAAQTKATDRLEKRLHSLEQTIKQLPKDVKDGTREGAHQGTRDGMEGRNQHAASFVRTGNGRGR